MFYFPLSDLCPHCNKKLLYIQEDAYTMLYCLVSDKDGIGWDNINFYALLSPTEIVRIDYRINNLRVINMLLDEHTKTYIYTKNTYISTPLAIDLTLFAPLNQPNIIEEKINTLLLLQ